MKAKRIVLSFVLLIALVCMVGYIHINLKASNHSVHPSIQAEQISEENENLLPEVKLIKRLINKFQDVVRYSDAIQ